MAWSLEITLDPVSLITRLVGSCIRSYGAAYIDVQFGNT